MAIGIVLSIKVLIIAFVAVFHSLQGRHIKAVVLAVLLYLGIPGFDDVLIQPIFAEITNLPMPLSVIVYFGIVWGLIILTWILF